MKKLIKLFEQGDINKIYEFIWKNKTKPTLKEVLVDKYSSHPLYKVLMYLLKYKEKNWFKYAVESDNLDLMKFLHKIKKKDNYVFPLTFYAVTNNNMETLPWLHENGYRSDDYVTGKAARLGHIECLKYLSSKNSPCTKYTFYEAAIYGNKECVEYLLSIDCEYNAHTFACAASSGHIDYLQLLFNDNCEKVEQNKLPSILWDSWSISNTQNNINSLDNDTIDKITKCKQCLNFLYKNDCPTE